MKYENLFNLLRAQAENLTELVSILNLQQEALINNNRILLDQSVKKEEETFNSVNQLQRLVISEIRNIDSQENLKLSEHKLSALLESLAGEAGTDVKKLKTARNHIVKLVKEVSRINFQNGFLIDHSRDIIRGIIKAAAGQKNSIMDRRM